MSNPVGLLLSKCAVQQQHTSPTDSQSLFFFEQKCFWAIIADLWLIWAKILGRHPPNPAGFFKNLPSAFTKLAY